MSVLSKLINLEFNSAALRSILSLFYKPGRYYRISFGYLRGLRIWYDRSINYHAVLGFWEKSNFAVLQKVIPIIFDRKSPVIHDIGANIGLFTLFFARLEGARVVAFEAVSDTVRSLNRNLSINSVNGVLVNNSAVSDSDGEVSFFIGHHHKSSLLKDWASDKGHSETREVIVPALRLDSFVKANPDLVPDLIKIDVEGGADKVLNGAQDILRKNRPVILIESHNSVEDSAIMKVLEIFKYEAYRINNSKWVLKKDQNYQHPDGVWGTMILFPGERLFAFQQVLK